MDTAEHITDPTRPVTLTPTESATAGQEAPEIRQLKEHIFKNRGASYPEPYSPANLICPTKLTDGIPSAVRLADALINGQTIVAVADFDCDGATSAAIFIRAMKRYSEVLSSFKMPKAKLHHVIPDRFKYGYGLKPKLADNKIKPLNPDVIVTLDNGISSHDACIRINQWTGISAANKSGAPHVIITDHHSQGDSLPKALTVVNPNRKDCPFPSKALAGCGVAFYLMILVRQALISRLKKNDRLTAAAAAIAAVQANHFSDLVAVGTIGDLVPMDANNRLLVKVGLDRINKGLQMPARKAHQNGYLSFGVRALLDVAKVTYPVTASDIAFQVVPRINAVGRLEAPTAGIDCLLSETQMVAGIEADRCHKLNEERKAVQKQMQEDADESLESLLAESDQSDQVKGALTSGTGECPMDSVVLHNESWHPGIVGLVASRIKERTKGAVLCFAPEGDPNADPNSGEDNGDPDWLKGSGRSDNVHLRDTLAYVATMAPDLMMQFGGHARAAGLSLHRMELNRFKRLFKEAVAHSLATAPLSNPVYADGVLPTDQRTHSLAAWIERQPWGNHFPEPTFTQNFKVIRALPVGARHQKLLVIDADAQPLTHQASNGDTIYPVSYGAKPVPMLWFFSRDEDNPETMEPGSAIEATYTLTVNRFRGQNDLQLIARKAERIGAGQ